MCPTASGAVAAMIFGTVDAIIPKIVSLLRRDVFVWLFIVGKAIKKGSTAKVLEVVLFINGGRSTSSCRSCKVIIGRPSRPLKTEKAFARRPHPSTKRLTLVISFIGQQLYLLLIHVYTTCQIETEKKSADVPTVGEVRPSTLVGSASQHILQRGLLEEWTYGKMHLIRKRVGACPVHVCLESESKEQLCILPCEHEFHHKCVEELRKFGVLQACPLSRAELPPGPERRNDDSKFCVYFISI